MAELDPGDVLRRRLNREHKARLEAEAIAERVTAELYATVEKLQLLNEELEGANAGVREFVAVASHDLANPLTSILGFTELLLSQEGEDGDPGRTQMLQTIDRSGRRMQRLLEDLLFLSRIEAGGLGAQPAAVDVAVEIGRAVDQLGEDGKQIDVDVPVDLIVYADAEHLQRVLSNYLSNAVKYGASPRCVQAVSVDGFAEIRVRDSGEGVPDYFIPKLFAKFQRADTTGGQPGTGLGLSIVRGLAQANGGDAWYEPNTPTGSCFGVRLPLKGGSA